MAIFVHHVNEIETPNCTNTNIGSKVFNSFFIAIHLSSIIASCGPFFPERVNFFQNQIIHYS